jgi:hypothetical protein
MSNQFVVSLSHDADQLTIINYSDEGIYLC